MVGARTAVRLLISGTLATAILIFASKGHGPATSWFKVPPADLTMLAKNNHREFPSDHVWAILHFGTKAAAHGSSAMPVGGNVLSGLEPTDTIEQEQRIANLVSYLKTLQAK
jgi:uncharacterized protein (DUF849 family)